MFDFRTILEVKNQGRAQLLPIRYAKKDWPVVITGLSADDLELEVDGTSKRPEVRIRVLIQAEVIGVGT
jgi:hypothetical protein